MQHRTRTHHCTTRSDIPLFAGEHKNFHHSDTLGEGQHPRAHKLTAHTRPAPNIPSIQHRRAPTHLSFIHTAVLKMNLLQANYVPIFPPCVSMDWSKRTTEPRHHATSYSRLLQITNSSKRWRECSIRYCRRAGISHWSTSTHRARTHTQRTTRSQEFNSSRFSQDSPGFVGCAVRFGPRRQTHRLFFHVIKNLYYWKWLGVNILQWKTREWKCGVGIVMWNGTAGDSERIRSCSTMSNL